MTDFEKRDTASGRFIAPACDHSGRVRPVVWAVNASGIESPNTVVCRQCWKVISADSVPHANYQEEEDGWFIPWPAC
jgi:hypothetical protein